MVSSHQYLISQQKLQPITAFLPDLLEVVKCSWVNKVNGEEEGEEEEERKGSLWPTLF